MRSLGGWALWLSVALVCACLLAGCASGPQQCPAVLVRSYSLVTVLAPDGKPVCAADVTVAGRQATVQSGSQDADCVYAVDNGKLGDGAHEVIAHMAGYVDAHGTIHVSGGGGRCHYPPPTGENITLQLVPAEGGVSDGGADAGPPDAASDGL